MDFQSSRGQAPIVDGLQAVINGLAPDGGLYVPVNFPTMSFDWDKLSRQNYQQIAIDLLSLFFDEFSKDELKKMVQAAYEKFDSKNVVEIHQLDQQKFLLELFHGPTLAFKDLALSFLPYLLTAAAEKKGEDKKLVILTATSGDTGGAALNGFAGVLGTEIVVYYPENGVSAMQRQQMTTFSADNTRVVGINGNFDDTQRAVKQLLVDKRLHERMAQKKLAFSSANSINIGRLVPQIVYYIYSYAYLYKKGFLKAGQTLDITVPTGNFGDILAAYWAKKIGLPVGKLTVASNENHVLTDFFTTGVYQADRRFHQTSSPAMDILVSSNLERLLFDYAGSRKISQWMDQLKEQASFKIDDQTLAFLQKDFNAAFTDEGQTDTSIEETFSKNDYLIDPHTAVAVRAQNVFFKDRPSLVVSTASPFKFSETVLSALKKEVSQRPYENIKKLSALSGRKIPASLQKLFELPVAQKDQLEIDQISADLVKTLKIDH